MSTTVWKGFLSFNMVTVPVKLYVAARNETVSFNTLHAKCGCKINQDTVCRTCGTTKLTSSDTVKGYEVEKDTYIKISPESIAALAPESSNTMTVDKFVKLSEVDPMLFDASYYMVPDEAGKQVYSLLYAAMKGEEKGAIVKVTMRQREYMALVRPYKHGLSLHTLFYEDEVREIPEFGGMGTTSVGEAENNLAKQLLAMLTKPFDHSVYHDEYRIAILALIERRKNGEEVPVTSLAPASAPKMDLMAMLTASLSMAKPAVEVVAESATAVKAEKPAPAPKKAKKAKVA